MSHLNTTKKRTIFAATLLSSVALCSALEVSAQSSATPSINYATPLSQIALSDSSTERQTLNWRKSSVDFSFNIPSANLTDSIELLISANPQGGVNPRAPLTVQFNSEEPVLLKVNGLGFDARLTLNPNKARTTRNVIRISYNAENGADCIGPQDGAWDVDLSASKIVVNSRAKRRGLQFRDLQKYLSNPGLAPRRVGLIASGQNATQLQALAAQGIGLNMEQLPEFTTDRQSSDFEIIMARRSELYQYISDDTHATGNGAAIFIPRGRPVKLVFTGDTDEDIIAGLMNFAEMELPVSRRSITSLGEMGLQRSLKSNLVRLSGTKALADIPSASSFSNWRGDDWASGSKSLRFDVTDPTAMTGEVLLRLASSKNVSDTSKLSVRLNGESLGTTILDKRRKSVAFEIKAGTLRGTDNVLTLMPEINPNEVPSCTATIGPNFHLGGGSKIILNTDVPSAVTELSRMTATAMPFSNTQGAQSYIAMTGGTADFNASLKVLARLAKTSGEGLIAAEYTRSLDLAQAAGKHILFMGPSNRLPSPLVEGAPRALTDALRGQAFEGDNLISANIEQFASLDANDSFKIAAQRLSQSRRIGAGGVAALYPSQSSNQHVIGVITNTPGQAYTVSADTISQNQYWSEIRGGVARWTEGSVLSVQAPQAVIDYTDPSAVGGDLALPSVNLSTSIFDGVYNKTTDIAEPLWDGLTGFISGLTNKAVGDKSLETPIKAESPISSAPITSQPNPPGPEIKPLERAEAIKPETRPDWAQVFQSKLRTANSWARDTGANIRENSANFKLGETISNIQSNLRPAGQKIRTWLKPNTTPYESQSFVQKLLNPTPLLIIIAFLLMLLGLVSSKTNSRNARR